MAEQELWAIKGPDGTFDKHDLSTTSDGAWRKHTRIRTGGCYFRWQVMGCRDAGYTAVRVSIVEVKDEP